MFNFLVCESLNLLKDLFWLSISVINAPSKKRENARVVRVFMDPGYEMLEKGGFLAVFPNDGVSAHPFEKMAG